MTDLAKALLRVADGNASSFAPLYELSLSIKEKIATIAREIYRADGVDYVGDSTAALARITKLGLDALPVCIAKTQYSFSDNAALRAAPTAPIGIGVRITVRDIEIAAGAGFVVPIQVS
jgi:formate--tetrahydrofolate ligase